MDQNRGGPVHQPGRERESPARLHQSGHSSNDRLQRMKPAKELRAEVGPVAYGVPEVLRRLGVTRPTIYRFSSVG